MLFSDLPASRSLGVSDSEEGLTELLRKVAQLYGHFNTVEGTTRSGRIVAERSFTGSVSFPSPMNPDALAAEFCNSFVEVARYDPRKRHLGRKGWEVRETIIQGQAAALVWTAWM